MHWITNLLFYLLGFITAFVCFGCAFLLKVSAEREEEYERWRKENLETQDDDRLEKIERREVTRNENN